MTCDIIIPVWNQMSLSRGCIDSIARCTRVPHRLIIVDNASSEETKAYLELVRGANPNHVVLIRNDENLGFIKAVNQGIRRSDTAAVCLLNNDTVVTDGWLEEMTSVLESADDIGIVNPSSNNLGQKPREGDSVESYARGLARERGRSVELGAAIGFCMLIKRRVLDAVGLLDEAYGMGNFEDTDLSRRAVKAGYRCVRACGAYVWHREHSSFRKVGTFARDFERNRALFESRWGKPQRIAYVVGEDAAAPLAADGPQKEFLRRARSGDWFWFFSAEDLTVPAHSQIRCVRLARNFFYARALFHLMKKKKKFDRINVASRSFGRVLESLKGVHRSAVDYYQEG